MLDGVELGEAPAHDDGARLSIIAGPAAQSCEDPCGIGQRTGGMWVLLLGGLAFETLRDSFQGRLVVGIEDVAERTLGFALALVDELHDLDGGDQNGGDELFERPVLLLAQRFDVKALGLHGPEQLLDGPAQTIEADDAAGIGDVVHLMGGQQEPERRLLTIRGDDEGHSYGLRKSLEALRLAGRTIPTVPNLTESSVVRAFRPGAAASSTTIRPASSQTSALENSNVPSARQRS